MGQATIVAEEADKGYRYETSSDSHGNFVLRIPEAGSYKITFSHAVLGNTSGGIISISPGDQPRMNMKMTA